MKRLYTGNGYVQKKKLTPERFHTPQYRDLLASIGHEITVEVDYITVIR